MIIANGTGATTTRTEHPSKRFRAISPQTPPLLNGISTTTHNITSFTTSSIKGQKRETTFPATEYCNCTPLTPKQNDLNYIDTESAGPSPAPDGDGYYFVEEIYEHRSRSGQWEFYCSFKGYDSTDNMWLPYHNLSPWTQQYALKLFGLNGEDNKLPIPTPEQQRAVDEAMRQSREIAYKRQLQYISNDTSDSGSDSDSDYYDSA